MPQDPFSGFLEGYISAKEQNRRDALEKAKLIMEQQNAILQQRRVEIESERQQETERYHETMAGLTAQRLGQNYDIALDRLLQGFSKIEEDWAKFQQGDETKRMLGANKDLFPMLNTVLRLGGDAGPVFKTAETAMQQLTGKPFSFPQGMPQDPLSLPASQVNKNFATSAYQRAMAHYKSVMTEVDKEYRKAGTDLEKARTNFLNIEAKEYPEIAKALTAQRKATASKDKAEEALTYGKLKELQKKLNDEMRLEGYLKKKGKWTQYLLEGKEWQKNFKDAVETYRKAVGETLTAKEAVAKMSTNLANTMAQMGLHDPEQGSQPDQMQFDANRIASIEENADLFDGLDSLKRRREIEKAAKARYDYFMSIKLEADTEINKGTGKKQPSSTTKTKAAGESVRERKIAPYPPKKPPVRHQRTRVDDAFDYFMRVHRK